MAMKLNIFDEVKHYWLYRLVPKGMYRAGDYSEAKLDEEWPEHAKVAYIACKELDEGGARLAKELMIKDYKFVAENKFFYNPPLCWWGLDDPRFSDVNYYHDWLWDRDGNLLKRENGKIIMKYHKEGQELYHD
jgi:hypothetical protein